MGSHGLEVLDWRNGEDGASGVISGNVEQRGYGGVVGRVHTHSGIASVILGS